MFVVTFANPKGGSGKTTSAMLLAEQIHAAGARVAILDCDPNQNIVLWSQMRAERGSEVPFIVEPLPAEDAFLEAVDALKGRADYVIIDLEGTASQIVTFATSQSDLVLIPFDPTPMEARQAARAVQLVQNTSKMLRREIPHALLFTRVNAAFQTNDEKDVRKETSANGVPSLETSIVRRSAYTRIFREASLLSELYASAEADVRNSTPSQQERVLKPLDAAMANAKAYAQEVVNLLIEKEAAA